MQALRKYFFLTLGALILIAIAIFSPWSEINQLIGRIEPWYLLLFVGLSLGYYLSKAYRYWYILKLLGVHQSMKKVMLVYFAAQPVSILPAGELYRSVLVEKYFQVKVSKTAPAFTLQGLIEAIVLISFSLVGAFLLGKSRVIVLAIAILMFALVIILRNGWLLGKHEWLNKLPFITINQEKYESFIKSHQVLLRPSALGSLVALSFIPVLCGTLILFAAATSMRVDLSFVEAAISYTLPVILSGLSFLPGGIGVGEGGTIGLLYVFGFSAAAAIATTMLMRVFTLIAGIVYGFIAQLTVHFIMERR